MSLKRYVEIVKAMRTRMEKGEKVVDQPSLAGTRVLAKAIAVGVRRAEPREGLTQEAAARQLGVSVKTVSRWVGGATEPRMRDLRRIQEVFGETPLR